MPIFSVNNLAEHGIITGPDPYNLPPNAWTFGKNVRFEDGMVKKFTGQQIYYDIGTNWDNTTGDIAYFALPLFANGTYYWIYCGLGDVYITDGTQKKKLTRVSGVYTSTADRNWTGGIISGIPVLNNGVDDPQWWDLNWAGSTRLQALTGWPANTKCSALRVYKNYLIAMDVTKSGTRYPQMVKWSDGAAIGAIPTSWDETDATKDAGENDLAESRTNTNVGAIIDSLHLRDTNILYTDSSVWSMQYIGGSLIFQFRELFQNVGIMSRRCAAEFEGKHFVVGTNDIYVHNGTSYQSVIEDKRLKFFLSDMNPSHYERTYVFANYAKKEMWVCYVENGNASNLPSKALVWNWLYNTWGIRELPNNNAAVASGGYGTPHIEGGVTDLTLADDIWSVSDGTWADWAVTWGDINFDPMTQSPLLVADKLYKGDSTNRFNGSNINSVITRTDLPIGNQDEFVRIKAVYPRISGTGQVNVFVGSQMAPGGAISYGSPVPFTPGTSQKVDVRKTGTHMAIRFESSGDQEWALSGYDVEFEPISRR